MLCKGLCGHEVFWLPVLNVGVVNVEEGESPSDEEHHVVCPPGERGTHDTKGPVYTSCAAGAQLKHTQNWKTRELHIPELLAFPATTSCTRNGWPQTETSIEPPHWCPLSCPSCQAGSTIPGSVLPMSSQSDQLELLSPSPEQAPFEDYRE